MRVVALPVQWKVQGGSPEGKLASGTCHPPPTPLPLRSQFKAISVSYNAVATPELREKHDEDVRVRTCSRGGAGLAVASSALSSLHSAVVGLQARIPWQVEASLRRRLGAATRTTLRMRAPSSRAPRQQASSACDKSFCFASPACQLLVLSGRSCSTYTL